MKSNLEIIVEAIRNRRPIIAYYEGHRRLLCPHVIGLKRGRLQGLFYQFGGTSGSGLRPPGHPANWRCMLIDAMDGVESSEGAWHTARNHSQPQTCVDRIIAEVAY
jgi:hypothetical protein